MDRLYLLACPKSEAERGRGVQSEVHSFAGLPPYPARKGGLSLCLRGARPGGSLHFQPPCPTLLVQRTVRVPPGRPARFSPLLPLTHVQDGIEPAYQLVKRQRVSAQEEAWVQELAAQRNQEEAARKAAAGASPGSDQGGLRPAWPAWCRAWVICSQPKL